MGDKSQILGNLCQFAILGLLIGGIVSGNVELNDPIVVPALIQLSQSIGSKDRSED